MEAAGSSMKTQSTSQHTPQLSPKKSPNKHAKFKQNNNNSPKRSLNDTSSARFPQNDNSISKDTIWTPNRSQNDIRIISGSFRNGPGTSAVRSRVPFPKKQPSEALISAIENHQNKQSIPKTTQDNTASQHRVPAVDSLVITVNNATPTQRIVQNYVQPQTVTNHVQPQTTVQNHVQPQTTAQNHVQPQTTVQNLVHPRTTVQNHVHPQTAVQNHVQPQTAVQNHVQPQTAVQNLVHPQTTVQNHVQLQTTVQNHVQPQTAVQNFVHPQTTVQNHVQPQTAVQNLVHPQTTVQNHVHPQTTLQNHMQPQTTVQNHVHPQTTLQNHMQPQTTLQNHVHPQTTLQNHMQPQTSVQNHVQPQTAVQNLVHPQTTVQNLVHPQTTVQNLVHPQTTVQNHVQLQTTSQNVSPSVQFNATSSKPHVFSYPQSRPFQFDDAPQKRPLYKLAPHMRYIGMNREHLTHTDNWRSRKHCDDDPDYYRKVIVTGFPAYTKADELVRKLSGLGTPSIELMKNRVAVIIFNDELEAHEALQANDTITVYGTILSIMKYTHRRHVLDLIRANKRVFRNENKGPPVAAPTEIDLSGDFDQQLRNIEDAIRLTQEEVDKINLLFEDVEKYMRMIYPTCEAVPFGSITTGQGIKSSDADCFLSLKPGSAGRPGAGAAELCSQFVGRAARVLRLYPEVFAHLVSIPRANTPIIKFLHVPTNVNCDLNSKTPLGVQNSRLLGHLLSCNPRFGSVALLLKYWARVQLLSGTGRLTNYALLLLLVFYLQRSLLPPVYELQSEAHSFIVEGWEAGFDRAPLPFLREVPPLRDLLGGFFLFYADFDFDDLVVCPLVGRPLRKAEFESNVLPAQYFLYRRNIKDGYALPIRTNCCICVQDPFELSHNVASAVSCRLATEIKAHIKLAAAAYAQEKSPGDFLRTILLTRPPLTETSNEARVAVRVSLPPKLLLELEDNWQDVVRDTMLNVAFKDLLFVELMRKDSVSREPGVNLEVYQGCVSRPVWRRGHNANARATPAELLKWHRETVARIVHDAPHVPDVHVPFEVEFGFRSIPRGFTITTSPLEGADQELFRSFRQFAHTFIHRWHKELLTPHLKEPARDAVKKDQKPATPKKSPTKSPKKSPKRTAEKRPVNINIATKDPPPIQSVAFVNSNHKDLSDSVAAINLIDSSIISFRIDDSSKLNLKIEDDAT